MSLFVEKSPKNSPLGHYPREVWLDLNTKNYINCFSLLFTSVSLCVFKLTMNCFSCIS